MAPVRGRYHQPGRILLPSAADWCRPLSCTPTDHEELTPDERPAHRPRQPRPERLATELESMTRPDDVHFDLTIGRTQAAVLAARGHDDEAEAMYRNALDAVTSGYVILELEILERLARFYRARNRDDDAVSVESRIAELVPAEPSSTARIA